MTTQAQKKAIEAGMCDTCGREDRMSTTCTYCKYSPANADLSPQKRARMATNWTRILTPAEKTGRNLQAASWAYDHAVRNYLDKVAKVAERFEEMAQKVRFDGFLRQDEAGLAIINDYSGHYAIAREITWGIANMGVEDLARMEQAMRKALADYQAAETAFAAFAPEDLSAEALQNAEWSREEMAKTAERLAAQITK